MSTVGRPFTSIVSGCPPLRDKSTRALYLSCFSLPNIRNYLASQEFHALARLVEFQRAGLAAGQHDADAEFLMVVSELLPDSLRAADDGVDPVLDFRPGLLLRQEKMVVLEDSGGGLRRRVTGRRDADALEQIADKVPEVRFEFLARLGVSFGNVD